MKKIMGVVLVGIVFFCIVYYVLFLQVQYLGVRYSQVDWDSMMQKAPGSQIENIKSSSVMDSLVYSKETIPVNMQLTQEEVTARSNMHKWKYDVTRDVQVRINNDGTVESSGKLVPSNIKLYAQRYGISTQKYDEIIQKIPGNPSYFVKAEGSIINNKLQDVVIHDMKIGAFSVPRDKIPNTLIEESLFKAFQAVPGTKVRSAKIVNGELVLDATIPKTLQVDEG